MSNSLNTPFNSTNSLLKASLGRESVKIYILTIVTVTIGYSNTRGIPYCKSSLWITSLVFPLIVCLFITVEPLSTMASFFGGQSIHWLMFKPLYSSQFILSPRWPLWRGSTVFVKKFIKNLDTSNHAEYHFQQVILNIKGLHWTLLMADLLSTGLEFWISAVVLVYYYHLFFPWICDFLFKTIAESPMWKTGS